MKAGLNLPWTQGTSDAGAECVFLGGAKEPTTSMGDYETWIDCGSKERARLISAAPELLEACIEARVWMLGRDGADRHLSMLDAAIAKATGDLDDPSTAWSGRAELAPGFSPMCLAPLDGTPVMLYMPTTGEKFAVGQWHGSPNSLHGNWGDDEGNYYVHEPACFMALSNLERLVQPSYKATGEQA